MHPEWTARVPLAARTTLRVGGPARYLVECADADAVREHLTAAAEAGIAVLVLGEGSNVLIADRGFDGLVLCPRDRTIRRLDGPALHVAAGAAWDQVVVSTVEAGWSGIECLSGIPGFMGAAPIQNIGAYGQELSEVLVAVDVVERATGQARRLDAAECGLAYRWSHFKGDWRDRFVITGVRIRLHDAPPRPPRYRDLIEALRERSEPTAAELRNAVLDIRRAKGMVLDDADPDTRSAGSFFTNPVVGPDVADTVERRAGPGSMPRFEAGPDRVKLSAAWLIERAGFRRGERRGEARLSTKHVLALTNPGSATATDLLALAIEIRRRVEDRLGVCLVPEPRLVGFTAEETEALSAHLPDA